MPTEPSDIPRGITTARYANATDSSVHLHPSFLRLERLDRSRPNLPVYLLARKGVAIRVEQLL